MNTLRPQIIPLLLLILSLLIFSGCAATDDSSSRLSPLEQALTDAITVELNDGTTLASAVSIDTATSTGTITITGDLTNACPALPCNTATGDTFATLTITKDDPTFTFAASAFTFDIDDISGAKTTTYTNRNALTINDGTDDIPLDIIVSYSGQLVTDLVTADNITNIISAEFASRDLNIALTGTTIALSGGTNASNGTGSISNAANLPDGYFVTDADGADYIITDPDGALTVAEDFSLPDSNKLFITERDDNGVIVDGNQESYAVTLSLAAAPALEVALAGAIAFDISNLELAAAVVIDSNTTPANPTGTITITGNLTNACSALPCDSAETATTFATLTLTKDDIAFTFAASPFTFAIVDVDGAQTTNVTTGNALTITNLADNSILVLEIIVEYSGQPIANIVAIDGIAAALPPTNVSVAFAGQDDNASAAWDTTGDTPTLTITGLFNPTGSGTAGSVSLTLADDFPNDYTVSYSSASFTEPAGTNTDTITIDNAFSIIEDADTANEVSYDLVVVLTAASTVSISASDLNISITNTLAADIIANITQLSIDTAAATVAITAAAGVRNLDGIALSLSGNTGSISLAKSGTAAAGLTLDATSLTTFSDPVGTETKTLSLGTFTASDGTDSTPYTLSLVLAPSYNVRIGGDASTTTIAELESIDKNLDRCEIFTYSLFTIDEAGDKTTVEGATFSTTSATPSPYFISGASSARTLSGLSATLAGDSPQTILTTATPLSPCRTAGIKTMLTSRAAMAQMLMTTPTSLIMTCV